MRIIRLVLPLALLLSACAQTAKPAPEQKGTFPAPPVTQVQTLA